jgi:hypothetical protein
MAAEQQSKSVEADQLQSTPQNSNELQLVPFVELDEGWIFSDPVLRGIFDKIDEQGLTRTVFWEGSIDNAEAFIKFVKNPSIVLQFIFEGKALVGMAWLGPLSGNYAFGHFCFFREIWGKRTQEAGEKVLRFWFGFPGPNGPLLDVIIGAVPDFNKRAHQYVQSIGFTELGTIPGMFKNIYDEHDNARIFYRTRK